MTTIIVVHTAWDTLWEITLVLAVLAAAITLLVPDLARWASDVLEAHSLAIRHFWRLIAEAGRMYRDTYHAEREWGEAHREMERKAVRVTTRWPESKQTIQATDAGHENLHES